MGLNDFLKKIFGNKSQRDLRETTEAAERPPVPGDPRSGPMRDVPPFGAGG